MEEKANETGAKLETTIKILGVTSTANRCVCVNIIKCNKTAAFTYKYNCIKQSLQHGLWSKTKCFQLVTSGGIAADINLCVSSLYRRTSFSLSWYMNSNSNTYWSAQNLNLIHKVPLQNVKLSMWCAGMRLESVGPIYYSETTNSHMYVADILMPFF